MKPLPEAPRRAAGRPRVLMVTGAYFPEVSGAGLQCRTLLRALGGRVGASVLTTCTDAALQRRDQVDGVAVHRVPVDVSRAESAVVAAARLALAFARLARKTDVVHLHGFSRKTVLLITLAKLWRKRVVLKLTSAGDDDPLSLRRRGAAARWALSRVDAFIAVSPRLAELYAASTLPLAKLRLIPNGVDLDRFRPASEAARAQLRSALDLPAGETVILFVGFFSRDKNPHLLFEAWRRLRDDAHVASTLVFVGATRSAYAEVLPGLATSIQHEARRRGLEKLVHFVERTDHVERYYAAADVFVLPSAREGLSNALLEAMASGLPCVATRLPGVTDHLIHHGASGMLVEPGDVDGLTSALQAVVDDPDHARVLGRQARSVVESAYGIETVARGHLELYQGLVAAPSRRTRP